MFIAGTSDWEMHPALYCRCLLVRGYIPMFIAGTSGIRDVPVDVYCRYVWWRYASSIILAWFIAGTSGGGMHPALYWRGLLQVRLVEVCIQHYTGVVYCRKVWWRYASSIILAWFIAGKSGGGKPPALCCRCLLQVCAGECVPGIMLSMFIAGVSVRVCVWHYAADVCCRYVWWRGCTRCSCRTG